MNESFTFAVANMGCKANLTDAQDLEARLRAMGGRVTSQDDAEVFVLNTCTVTDQADREALQILRKTKAPLVLATGCLAEVDPEKIQATRQDLTVVRNSAKSLVDEAIREWLAGREAKVWQGDRSRWHTTVDYVSGSGVEAEAEARTRAFLKVQDGCNAFCSYCIIPRARGRSRSLTPARVVGEVNALVEKGIQEIVLTAIHAADYESEGLDFTGLVERVLRETKVPRIRLTSLDPAEIPDRLLALMENEPRLCPHFHVSLQSASTKVLREMKRGYDGDRSEACLNEIAKRIPHAFVGMDVIAGFPGETDTEFNESFALLERTPWTRLHVFPFSVRRSTAAERMVAAGLGVPPEIIKTRAAALRRLSDERYQARLLERQGKLAEILIETKPHRWGEREFSMGYTRNYFKVAVPGKYSPNQLLRVRIGAVLERDVLAGEVV